MPHDQIDLDPIRLEVLRKALAAAAGEMGLALSRAAYSTNIKTRLDYSCAIFDAKCRMLAQSFTQPVHLGTLTHFVPKIIESFGYERLRPGDALLCNDGYLGGIHLNDVCLVAPVYTANTIIGFVATIAHHVDIGGGTAGSIGRFREIFQEGLQIPPTRLVRDGVIDEDILALIVRNVRSPAETAGDFRAQVAGIRIGQRAFGRLADKYGVEQLTLASSAVLDYSERMTRAAIRRQVPDGEYLAEGYLDDDGFSEEPIYIKVTIQVNDGSVHYDLTECAAQRKASINTTYAMAFSACAYTLRGLLGKVEIDMNDGFYRCVEVVTRRGTVADAIRPVAISAGSDTGARILEVALRAFGAKLPDRVPADSKGTMCNVSCGGTNPRTGEQFAFYEAQAGGYGGRLGLDGIDGVQPHMQNTENSPIEETEASYPLFVERYELIPGSGGVGQFRGGLGIRRDYSFEGEVDFTVMADRVKLRPEGAMSGGPGRGCRFVVDPDGTPRELPSKFTVRLAAGEIISLQTAGGGGWGDPSFRTAEKTAADVANGITRQV